MSASAEIGPAPQPSPIFLKTVSGFASQAWMGLVSLVCFPVFIHLLGMEAFGLFGFYLTLLTILRVLDLGLTPTVIRELARSAASPKGTAELAGKAGTFETSFAVGGAVIAVALLLMAPWIAHHWLRSENIPPDTITFCITVMAIQCGVNWLSAFYQSTLVGLERQILLNVMRTVEATLSFPGALALVFFTGSDVRLVFLWQLGIGAMMLCCYLVAFRRSVPGRVRTFGFQLEYLRQIRSFATGMAAITLLGLVLTYMDKVFLSRFLSLEQFGNYSLAAFAVATLFGMLVQPVANVMFPRFSALAARGGPPLSDIYHLTIQAFAVITGPVLIGVLLFARDFLEVWTNSATIADTVAVSISWLAAGYTLNSLMIGPYLLQIACGWTSIGVRINVLLVAVFLPALVILSSHFGAAGAAANYAAMNASYLAIGLAGTHVRLLPGQWRDVLLTDLAPTAMICTAIFGIVLVFPLGTLQIYARLVVGLAIVSVAIAASAFASGRTRHEVLNKLHSWSSTVAKGGSVSDGKTR